MANYTGPNSFGMSGGFNISNNQPIDSRIVVNDISDVIVADNWVGKTGFIDGVPTLYDGLIVSDKNGNVRVLADSNFWNVPGAWKEIGGGADAIQSETDPTPTDDISKEYKLGQLWINAITQTVFILINNTENSARWLQLLNPSSLEGLGDMLESKFATNEKKDEGYVDKAIMADTATRANSANEASKVTNLFKVTIGDTNYCSYNGSEEATFNIISGYNVNLAINPENKLVISTGNSSDIITSLAGYSKPSSLTNLSIDSESDSLNTALGKLEYKTENLYSWMNLMIEGNAENTIDTLKEVFDLLDGIKADDTLVNQLLNKYLPLDGSKAMTGALLVSSIQEPTGSGLLAYKPDSGWTGLDNTKWGVGALDVTGVIRSNDNDLIHHRHGKSDSVILDSLNYSSYALPLTGGTITGRGYGVLEIKNNGNEGSTIKFSNANKILGHIGFNNQDNIIYYDAGLRNGYVLYHEGNFNPAEYLKRYSGWYAEETHSANDLVGGTTFAYANHGVVYNGILVDFACSNRTGYRFQINASYYSNDVYVRHRDGDYGVWSDWFRLMFSDENAVSATKLATPRSLWGQSFDGTGNVSGDLSGVYNITMSGNIYNVIGLYYNDTSNGYFVGSGAKTGSVSGLGLWAYGNNPIALFTNGPERMRISGTGNVLIGTTTDNGYKLQVEGTALTTGDFHSKGIIKSYRFSSNRNWASFVFDKPGSYHTGIGSTNEADTIFFGAVTEDGNWVNSYMQKWKFNGDIIAQGNISIGGNEVWHTGNTDHVLYGDYKGFFNSVSGSCNDYVERTGFYTSSNFNDRPGAVSNWGTLQTMRLYASNTNYTRQLFFDCYNTDRIWTRSQSSGEWTSWKELITSANIDSQVVKALKSTGYVDYGLSWLQQSASLEKSENTWASYIINNHAGGSSAYAQILRFDFFNDKIEYIRRSNGNLGQWRQLAFIDSTVANADALAGYPLSAIPYAVNNGGFGTSDEEDTSLDLSRTMFWRDNMRSAIGMFVSHAHTSDYGWELWKGYNSNRFYTTVKVNGVWSSSMPIAFLSDNVASASKLETPRTIWGQPFDGSSGINAPGIMAFLYFAKYNDYSSSSGNYIGNGSSIGNDLLMYAAVGNIVRMYSNGAEVIRLSAKGNVLIGTTTDDGAHKLQLQGSAKTLAIQTGLINTSCINAEDNSYTLLMWNGASTLMGAASGVTTIRSGNTDLIHYRGGSNEYILDTSNYHNYALPLSGGTISSNTYKILKIHNTGGGYPSIEFEGNVSYGYLGFTGANQPAYFDNSFNPYHLIHSGNIASQSVYSAVTANALRIDNNATANAYSYAVQYLQTAEKADVFPDNGWWHMLRFHHAGYTNGYWLDFALSFNTCPILMTRSNHNGNYSNWNQIAYISSNVASASKLTTVSKTIWGQTYWTADGVPTSISGDMTSVGNITTYAGSRISAEVEGDLYIGSEDNYAWVYMQDIASQNGYDNWAIYTDGTAEFAGSVTSPNFYGTATTANYVKTQTYTSTRYIVGVSSYSASTSTYLYTGNPYINSSNAIYAGGGFYESSDIRLKDIIGKMNVSLDEIKSIPKIYYNLKADPTKTKEIGTIAQDILPYFPEVVSMGEDGYYNVDYAKLSVIALAAIDKLIEENERLKARLSKLEYKVK